QTQPAAATSAESAPAVAAAAFSNAAPSAEAAPTTVARTAAGTGGSRLERNFAQDSPASSLNSARIASAAAQREATQRDAASDSSAPREAARVPRSTAGSQAPQAALQATTTAVTQLAGSRAPTDFESSLSAATRTSAAQAPQGMKQADAGTQSVDIASS